MITYNRGDVILVDIAFSGQLVTSDAVVISASTFNEAGIKLVVAAVTSNVSPPFRPGGRLLSDWRAAGLVKPSAARGVLATVDKSDVARKLGVLSATDFASIEQGVAEVLGFAVSAVPKTSAN